MTKQFYFNYLDGEEEYESAHFSTFEEAEIARGELDSQGYEVGKIEEIRS